MREPHEFEYFRAMVEPRLGGEVEYLGEVGPADKYQLLGAARCLLNPIAWPEPFGMVMIEALACGTPVDGTPCGAAPEIVDDGVTGLLRTDPQALVDALVDVERIDRDECRKAVGKRFSMSRMAEGHVAAYESLVDGGRAEAAELVSLLRQDSDGHADELVHLAS